MMPEGTVTREEAIWQFCGFHRHLLKRSAQCGCFYCLRLFSPSEIEAWTDHEQTALCPHCCIDAVLPDVPLYVLNAELMREMHEAFF